MLNIAGWYGRLCRLDGANPAGYNGSALSYLRSSWAQYIYGASEMTAVTVAAVQMTSTADKPLNLRKAESLVRDAAARGAVLIALPELFNCLGEPEIILEQAEEVPGPTSESMSRLAAECQITLLAGSIAERVAGEKRIFNSSLLFGPDGRQLACYRKIHLFDIDLPGHVTFRESAIMGTGSRIVMTQTGVGLVGQAICYDLRFPELFRRLSAAGADLFVIPSAFTLATGRDHWEVLLRARAIENQVHVIAPNQVGRHSPSLQTYGRSMIIDPWGTVLATAPDGDAVVTAVVDLERQSEIRSRLPALQHRRAIDELPVSIPTPTRDSRL